jgi:prevent-host-death family protein
MTMEGRVDDAELRISAAEFKTNCLRLMDEVARRRVPVIITKRGKPVAKLVPMSEEPIDIFGRMAGTIRICGDIVGPTGEMWEGDAENI